MQFATTHKIGYFIILKILLPYQSWKFLKFLHFLINCIISSCISAHVPKGSLCVK